MPYDFDRVIERRHTNSNKWRKYPADVLPLWVADMDFPSPEPVVRALRERVEHGVYGYGFEGPEFAEVFVDRVQKRYGWTIAPESLVLIPGVIPGFNVACRALTAPGDGLLMQLPVYPPILRSPTNHGLTRDGAMLGRERDGRYVADLDAFRTAIHSRTRAFILCNPHNPVGRAFTRDELGGMARVCLERDIPIIADEIHCDLLFGGQRHVPIASLSPEIERRTITLMAPSKTFNLAGLKVSVAVIPDASLRERFMAARGDYVQASVNVLGYAAALAAYRDGQEWLDELLRYLEGNRDFLVDYVRRHLPGVSMVAPEGTYLAWLDCRHAGPAAADPFTFFLERAKVALNDGALFGAGGQGFVRLNFGTPRALLTEGLERMRRALGA
jgi:cysteine-S-conjugate beta-lyase